MVVVSGGVRQRRRGTPVILLPLVQRHSSRAGGADDGFADEDGGLPSSALCFLSVSALSLVLSPSLFCFGFSYVAAGGSADGDGMAVLDGGGRRPRWRERSSCWEPEKDDFVF